MRPCLRRTRRQNKPKTKLHTVSSIIPNSSLDRYFILIYLKATSMTFQASSLEVYTCCSPRYWLLSESDSSLPVSGPTLYCWILISLSVSPAAPVCVCLGTGSCWCSPGPRVAFPHCNPQWPGAGSTSLTSASQVPGLPDRHLTLRPPLVFLIFSFSSL